MALSPEAPGLPAGESGHNSENSVAHLDLLLLSDYSGSKVEITQVQRWDQDPIAILRERIPFEECSRSRNDFIGVA
jgi:hypothetical protein